MPRPRVVLIGDTSLDSPHFGCQLVGQTFREQFARAGLELYASLPYDYDRFPQWPELFEAADLLVINGEGSIHHGRFGYLIELAARYPAALVNCVYQENPAWPALSSLRYIAARESLSGEEVRSQGVSCRVVPDVIFASAQLRSFVRPAPSEECGITDNARKTTYRLGPIKLRLRPGYSPKQPVIADYLRYLCRYRRLCIGRFHAAIAASVLGIPFSTWDSNTWKLKGLMQDMGVPHLHFAEYAAARTHVPTELDHRITAFASQAQARVEAMFDDLAAIAAGIATKP